MSRKLFPAILASIALLGWLAIDDSPTSAAEQAAVSAEKKAEAEKKDSYKLVAPLDTIMYVADEMFYDLEDHIEEGKFRTIHRSALFLAEVSNITAHADVETAAGADAKKVWKELANKNKDDLLRLAETSKSRDAKKVKSIWTTVEETCDSCHEKFRDV